MGFVARVGGGVGVVLVLAVDGRGFGDLGWGGGWMLVVDMER